MSQSKRARLRPAQTRLPWTCRVKRWGRRRQASRAPRCEPHGWAKGPLRLIPARDAPPGITLGPAPPRRRGEKGGRRPSSRAIKSLGPPRLASASSGPALTAFLSAPAPVPAQAPLDLSGLSYSGCGRRWRLRRTAMRRRWLLP